MLYSKCLHFTKLLYSKWKEEEVETCLKFLLGFHFIFYCFFGFFYSCCLCSCFELFTVTSLFLAIPVCNYFSTRLSNIFEINLQNRLK